MPEAGLPQVHQTVQPPAAGGAHRQPLHTLPRGQGQHAARPHCLPNLHQVQIFQTKTVKILYLFIFLWGKKTIFRNKNPLCLYFDHLDEHNLIYNI